MWSMLSSPKALERKQCFPPSLFAGWGGGVMYDLWILKQTPTAGMELLGKSRPSSQKRVWISFSSQARDGVHRPSLRNSTPLEELTTLSKHPSCWEEPGACCLYPKMFVFVIFRISLFGICQAVAFLVTISNVVAGEGRQLPLPKF